MNYTTIILFLLVTNMSLGQAKVDSFYQTKSVKFANRDLNLNGQLYIPNGKGPFPAVIFTHGSGDSGVDNKRYILEAEYFAKHGILSMVYDKRGYGKSEGDWRLANYEDLAQDALAAVKLLTRKKQVDTSKIGLRGISQSGWVLPIVAKLSKEVDFLILISPPGVTTAEQIIYDVRTDVEDLGYKPDDVEQAIEVIESGMTYAKTLSNWARHQDILEKYKDKKWIDVASGPPVEDHWLWRWVNPVLDFDAVPLVHETKAAVLVILGEKDRVIPAQVAGYRFRKALGKRAEAYKVVYFSNAGHDLRVVRSAHQTDEPPLVVGYLETMKNWILGSN